MEGLSREVCQKIDNFFTIIVSESQLAWSTVRMVSLDAPIVPMISEKKKKNKKRKLDEAKTDLEENLVVTGDNLDIIKKKKKKAKKDAEIIPVVTELPSEDDTKPKKKKKKSKEEKETDAAEALSDDEFDVDGGEFKKKFYTPDATTEAMTKVTSRMCQMTSLIINVSPGRDEEFPVEGAYHPLRQGQEEDETTSHLRVSV